MSIKKELATVSRKSALEHAMVAASKRMMSLQGSVSMGDIEKCDNPFELLAMSQRTSTKKKRLILAKLQAILAKLKEAK